MMSKVDEKAEAIVSRPPGTPLYILAPFVPTPQDVVERMLRLAEVAREDTVYDLGCGDGRIIIAAAKLFGSKGVGVEVEPYWVAESRSNAQAAGVEHLVRFELQDAMTLDFSEATVLTLYLVHWSTAKLGHIIQKTAKPGTRIVSHNFDIPDWIPLRSEEFTDEGGHRRTLYLWIVSCDQSGS